MAQHSAAGVVENASEKRVNRVHSYASDVIPPDLFGLWHNDAIQISGRSESPRLFNNLVGTGQQSLYRDLHCERLGEAGQAVLAAFDQRDPLR